MENNEEIINKTNDLIASLTYYRLLSCKKLIEDDIAKNASVSEKENDNAFKKGIIKVGNSIRKTNSSKFEGEKQKIEFNIEKFKQDCSKDVIYQYGEDEEKLKQYINEFLAQDKNDYVRNQIALSVLIDNRYNISRSNESLEKVSKLLYGDDKKIKVIKKVLDKNLRQLLSDQKLETVGKNSLIALSIAIAATMTFVGSFLTSAALGSANIAQVLANLAHAGTKQFGKGVAIVTAVAAGVVLVGGVATFAELKYDEIREDEKKFKEAIRNMKPTDLAASIAIRLSLAQLAKEKSSKAQLKEYKEAILKDVDYIRSDTEYLFIVEKVEENENKTKSSICNKTIQILSTL